MNIDFKLLPEAVATDCAPSFSEALTKTAELYSKVYGLDQTMILEGLEERESLGSTGFGRGVSIPHCRSSLVKRPTVTVLKLTRPVDCGAADGMPVCLVFGLVSPENAGATHLHALAAISRMVRDDAMMEMLLDAPDDEALYALLTNRILRDAA